MKKNILIAAIVGIILVGGVYGVKKYSPPQTKSTVPSVTATPVSTITIVLNTGQEVSTVSGVEAENAFTALTGYAKQKNLTLKTKHYDFGVFVDAIGTLANTKEKAWVYFVNGKEGTVAADKQQLHSGDMVEWKYVTPTIE